MAKGKDVRVDINRKHLKVSFVTASSGMTVVIDDDLTWEVNKENSLWTIVPGEHIHVSLYIPVIGKYVHSYGLGAK